MTPIEFTRKDGMPVEVATQMLCAPGVRLTNRMRKTCQAARQKTIQSPSPVRRTFLDGELGTDEEQIKRPIGEKAARRFAHLPLVQLLTARKHTLRNRLAVQRPFEAARVQLQEMEAEEDKAKVTANVRRYQAVVSLLQALAEEARKLDDILDAAEEELEKRGCIRRLRPAPLSN